MVHEPGTSTRDLRTAGHVSWAEKDLPAEQREDRVQRWGSACILIGSILIALTFIAALSAAIISEQVLFPSRIGVMFALLGTIASLTGGGVTLAYGLQERLHRPHRSMSRLSYGAGREIVDRLDKLEQRQIDSEDQAALTAAAVHRIETVIDKVPNTGQIIAQALRLAGLESQDRP